MTENDKNTNVCVRACMCLCVCVCVCVGILELNFSRSLVPPQGSSHFLLALPQEGLLASD